MDAGKERRAPRKRSRAPTASLGFALIAALLLAGPAGAFVPSRGARPLLDLDVRKADSAPLPAGAKSARTQLSRSLGPQGVVSTDRITGSARLVARRDGSLTGRSKQNVATIALDYVRAQTPVFGLDDNDLGALRLTSRYTSPDGVTHLVWAQTAHGVASYDSVLLANVAKDGRIVNIGGSAVPDLGVGSARPAIGASAALAAAKRNVRGSLIGPRARRQAGAEQATRFSSGERARLTLFSDGERTRLAWRVEAKGKVGMYEVVVDATSGDVLLRHSLTDFVSNASVFDNHPGAASGGTAHSVDLDADPTWLNRSAGFTILRGNNTHTYADTAAPDGVGPTENIPPNSGTDWVYPLTPFDVAGQACPLLGATPACTWNSGNNTTKNANRQQVTTQLFYQVNRFHDHLKAAPIGFTHAARGFEFTDADGVGGPGLGGDPVLAESNDFSATNNADMSTPPDGGSPRMQMYFFSNPSLNSGDAADIIWHEYTHGLTNRSVGSGAGINAEQSAAMGEGWSDWYALDWLVALGLEADTATNGELKPGAYLVPGGFRRQGLDCPVGAAAAQCPGAPGAGPGGFTLGDMGNIGGGFEVHDDGEIWAETLWDIRAALGSTTAEALVTGALRLSPDDPSFLEERDAVIQADQAAFGGTNYTALWTIFANRGMGFSATTPNADATNAVEAFDLPPALANGSSTLSDPGPGGDGDGVAEPGESFTLNEVLRNPNPFQVTGASAVLSTSTSNVTVTQPNATFPTFGPQASHAGSPPFGVSIQPALTCGTSLQMSLAVTTDQGNVTLPFKIQTGAVGTAVALNSSDVPKAIPDDNPIGTTSVLTVPTAGIVRDVDVRIGSLTHDWDGDLKIDLVAPNGTVVNLVNRPGGAGNNGDDFTNTVFNDEAATAIGSGAPPYSGSFRPQSDQLSRFDGGPKNGTWTLRLYDLAGPDAGTLNSWGHTISPPTCSGGSPPPPPPPPAPPPPPPPPPPPAPRPPPPPASDPVAAFGGSPKSLSVGSTGRFSYRFTATPLRSGKIGLKSTKKVKVGSQKRTLKLASKSFSAPSDAKVKVKFKLSRTSLKALKRVRSLRFKVTVTLGGATFTTTVKLKKPKG